MKATISFCGALFLTLCGLAVHAQPGGGDLGSTPPINTNPCLGQLTRTADVVITMQANKREYLAESNDTPFTTYGPFSFSTFSGCTRRVIELRVPSTTSSGCADCYMNAEIHACAGAFPGSKSFEEICRVPVSSTSEQLCKSFSHKVEVYKRPAGATQFNTTPLRTFVYKGFIDANGQCRVAAQYLGQIHDTSEVYPTVFPPASGQDRYRILSYPVFNGTVLSTEIAVEFEMF
jgi:hypothetical protein